MAPIPACRYSICEEPNAFISRVRIAEGCGRVAAGVIDVDSKEEQSPGGGWAGSPDVRSPATVPTRQALLLVVGSVPLDEFLLVFGHIFERMDRVGGANRNTGAAIDAAIGIYVHLGRGFELRLVLLRMNAVRGAHVDAEGVFNAGIGNYIGHDESVSWNERFRLSQDQSREGGAGGR